MAEIVNPAYAKKSTIAAIHKHLTAEGSVQLRSFFTSEAYATITKEIHHAHYVRKRQPLKGSFAAATISRPLRKILASPEFIRSVGSYLGKKATTIDGEFICLTWRDYTVLHDDIAPTAGTDVIIDCTEGWDSSWGGGVVYTDGAGNTVTIKASPNALILATSAYGMMRFFQYTNHYAQGKMRYLFVGKVL